MLMTTLLPYLDSYPNIGEIFSAQRHQHGRSIDDVCMRLSVSRFYVIGLESNRLDLLPTVEETRNLITRYSQLLTLDTQPVLTKFDTWLASCPIPEQTSVDIDVSATITHGWLKAAAIAGLLLLYPASTTHFLTDAMVITHTVTDAEPDLAQLEFETLSPASEHATAAKTTNKIDTSSTTDFAPKPYSDTRNADDIERDRLFYLQEQIRLGLEPVAKPYKG